jgi:hypothetical protein
MHMLPYLSTRRKLAEILTHIRTFTCLAQWAHYLKYLFYQPISFLADRIYLSTGKFIRLLNIIDEIKLARSFNFTSRYVDDVLSLTISTFGDFVDCIYPTVPNLKDVSRLVVILAHTTCMQWVCTREKSVSSKYLILTCLWVRPLAIMCILWKIVYRIPLQFAFNNLTNIKALDLVEIKWKINTTLSKQFQIQISKS